MTTQEVKTRTIRGLTLLVAREGVVKVIAILGQLVLVRLLLPEYFGVLAIVTFFVNTADLFTDLGLVSGIIQSREKPSHQVLSSLFWIKFALTAAAVAILLFISPFLRTFFPGLTPANVLALNILTFTLLLRPLRTIILGLLERELRYDLIPVVDVGGLVVYFVAAIIMALSGWGIWSLVWSLVIKDSFELILLEIVSPFLPRFHFSRTNIKTFLGFGAPLQANTIIGFLLQSTIPFLGGLLTTPQVVGLLDWGFNIASIPRVLSYNVGRIALPSFSRIQGQPELIARGIEESVGIMVIFNLFFLLGSIFFASQGVELIVGPRWLPAVPALPWLVLGELFLAVIGVLQQAVIARGLTKILMRISFVGLLVQWASVVLLFRVNGFVGIAQGICFGLGFGLTLLWYLVSKAGISVRIRTVILPHILVFLISLPLCWALSKLPSSLMFYFIKLAMFGCGYAVLVVVFANGSFKRVFSLLRNHLISW